MFKNIHTPYFVFIDKATDFIVGDRYADTKEEAIKEYGNSVEGIEIVNVHLSAIIAWDRNDETFAPYYRENAV